MPGAFDGVRVVEFGEGVAAPYAAALLAEQGAEVIKVERPAGDRARALLGFQVWNRSKLGVMADPSSIEGRALLNQLAAGADLFIWDRTQEEARLEGVDAVSLRSRNAHLIYLAMPPYGERGPHACRRGDESLIAAYNGILHQQPTYSVGPGFVVTPFSSIATAILGAAAAGMALYHRARTGWSGVVELPGIAGGLAHQPEHVMELNERPAVSDWSLHPLGAFPLFALQPCADGYLALGVSAPRQWYGLAVALGHPEWVSDPRFEHAPWGIPPAERGALRELLHAQFRRHTVRHWLDTLGPLDLPVGPISTREEYIKSEQVRQNGMRVELEVPGLGRTAQLGVAVRLNDTPGAVVRRAPLLGEHTTEVAQRVARPRTPLRTGADDPSLPPLAGVRVIELNAYTAGPYGGGLLASFGADVVRIEPLDGDPTRQLAYTNFAFNGRKRSTSLDLKAPGMSEAVRGGIRQFDVLLENNRPGVLHRLGIGYEDLHPIHPRLIFASAYGWGTDGPMALAPSFDILVQARSGMLAAQGEGPHEPCYTTNLVADFGGALLNVFMIAAALYARERTGRGQWAISLLAASTMVMQAGEFVIVEGKPARHFGARDVRGVHPGYRLYRCADDRWLFIACTTSGHWEALAKVVVQPLPQWRKVESLGPEAGPGDTIARWCLARDREGVLAALDAAGVPAAPVNAAHELTRDAQLERNGLLVDYMHPAHGPMRILAPLAKFEGTRETPPAPDPGLGEHTREQLRAWGASDHEIERWLAAGQAIQGGPITAPA